jgi:hypothetical protein
MRSKQPEKVGLAESNGEDAAARGLLLAALDQLLAGKPHDASPVLSRSTIDIQNQLRSDWKHDAEQGVERAVMPRFVPVIVDSRLTIAAALGGARFSGAC